MEEDEVELCRLRTDMEVLIEDQMRAPHKTKNDDEENAVQMELMQRKATEICAGCQRDGRS